MSNNTNSSNNNDCHSSNDGKNFPTDDKSLAKAETRVVNILRIAVLLVLVVAAALISSAAYLYTRDEEVDAFHAHFEGSVLEIAEAFHDTVERNIGAASALSTEITSYALESNSTFPFVTLPDFELKGSHLRQQSGSHIVHWLPLVTDDKREDWEEYAYEKRVQIQESFQRDGYYRTEQDMHLATGANTSQRALQEQPQEGNAAPMTVLEDGYHQRIWSNGAVTPKGDMPEGSGPFLPAWQRK